MRKIEFDPDIGFEFSQSTQLALAHDRDKTQNDIAQVSNFKILARAGRGGRASVRQARHACQLS